MSKERVSDDHVLSSLAGKADSTVRDMPWYISIAPQTFIGENPTYHIADIADVRPEHVTPISLLMAAAGDLEYDPCHGVAARTTEIEGVGYVKLYSDGPLFRLDDVWWEGV